MIASAVAQGLASWPLIVTLVVRTPCSTSAHVALKLQPWQLRISSEVNDSCKQNSENQSIHMHENQNFKYNYRNSHVFVMTIKRCILKMSVELRDLTVPDRAVGHQWILTRTVEWRAVIGQQIWRVWRLNGWGGDIICCQTERCDSLYYLSDCI